VRNKDSGEYPIKGSGAYAGAVSIGAAGPYYLYGTEA